MRTSRQAELSAWIWLWLPAGILVSFLLTRVLDHAFYNKWVESEQGVMEMATPLILLAGIYFGIRSLLLGRTKINLRNYLWLGLVTLGCIYYAGEEISWGQQLFGWNTPELFQEINDQNETNLHNISSWFDQKPRLLLELWVLTGGILLPAFMAVMKKEYESGSWEYWFWPTTICVPDAVISILIKMPERIKDVFGLAPYRFEVRWSELQEFFFAIFLSLYLASIYVRLSKDVTKP